MVVMPGGRGHGQVDEFARAKSQFMSSKSPMLVTRFYIFSTVYT